MTPAEAAAGRLDGNRPLMHNQSTSTRPASLRSPSSYGHNDRSVLPQATGSTVGIAPIGREYVLHPDRGPITLRDQKNRSEVPIADYEQSGWMTA